MQSQHRPQQQQGRQEDQSVEVPVWDVYARVHDLRRNIVKWVIQRDDHEYLFRKSWDIIQTANFPLERFWRLKRNAPCKDGLHIVGAQLAWCCERVLGDEVAGLLPDDDDRDGTYTYIETCAHPTLACCWRAIGIECLDNYAEMCLERSDYSKFRPRSITYAFESHIDRKAGHAGETDVDA